MPRPKVSPPKSLQQLTSEELVSAYTQVIREICELSNSFDVAENPGSNIAEELLRHKVILEGNALERCSRRLEVRKQELHDELIRRLS